MNWKNLPSWLKGGIIGLIPILIVMLADFIFTCNFGTHSEFCGLFTIFASFPLYIITISKYGIFPYGDVPTLVVIILPLLSLVMYFLVGALIGWIVGKFKSKNKSQLNKVKFKK